MGKAGEIDFLKNFGPDAVKFAMEKPFSDPNCWRYFLELGALMGLLPPPPGRLLDLGCGTGWTSRSLPSVDTRSWASISLPT